MRQLRKHLDKDCVIAKKRRGLLESAKLRKLTALEEEHQARLDEQLRQQQLKQAQLDAAAAALLEVRSTDVITTDAAASAEEKEPELPQFVVCPQCSESVKNSQLVPHLKEKCSMRKIMCPNIHSGCDQRLIPLSLLQHHLQFNCRAEQLRDEMIARSKVRYEPMQCTACGEFVPAMLLRKHEVERCENRRVPCRNQCLGCNVMVRLRERDLHEQVDGKRQLRYALYLGSHGAHLAIQEDDIPCPWTAEYWVYRPPITVSDRRLSI